MTAGELPQKNTIFTEDVADAARARLKKWFSSHVAQSDEAQAKPDGRPEDGEDALQADDGEGSDCDAVEQIDHIDDLFPFKRSERSLIYQIEKTISRHLLTADPATLKKVAAFLHALRRLPYSTLDVSLDLVLMHRVEGDRDYVSVELNDQAFRLSTGGSSFSSDFGSNRFSSTTFEIEIGGFRAGTTQDSAEWLDQFVSAVGTMEIHGDGEADLTEIAPVDGWERLDRYWEHCWDDDDGY